MNRVENNAYKNNEPLHPAYYSTSNQKIDISQTWVQRLVANQEKNYKGSILW